MANGMEHTAPAWMVAWSDWRANGSGDREPAIAPRSLLAATSRQRRPPPLLCGFQEVDPEASTDSLSEGESSEAAAVAEEEAGYVTAREDDLGDPFPLNPQSRGASDDYCRGALSPSPSLLISCFDGVFGVTRPSGDLVSLNIDPFCSTRCCRGAKRDRCHGRSPKAHLLRSAGPQIGLMELPGAGV
ncbi:hypothetical protein AAFF_G00057810 [Aldrovandia affinis]|uniref:Uncharacterized protein n=1 Tax=Aldrovandia affinis TaxID=143900 RepID=A0AAD7S0I5_9TELE|nr:hypothetical protein AAFF_G00057810 [Aldrovandia affinis]